ncbi:MAG: dTMP kinase [Coriobacteriales bacterium]|jgi:dTMP kinase|nr:dTMP kinase [Coriobacteriales bacterium]
MTEPIKTNETSKQTTGTAVPAHQESKGIFVTFEGGEGVGKSTQIQLLKARLKAFGYDVITLREPGGTQIGEQIRTILLEPTNTAMSAVTELLLYEAARAQLVQQVIAPHLQSGKVVLCDRFSDSTLAYQAAARGLDINMVRSANALGTGGLTPSRTIVLSHDVKLGLAKAAQKGPDRLEAEDVSFHQKVHAAFEQLATDEPKRVRLVRIHESKADTAEAIFAQLGDLFPAANRQSFTIDEALLNIIKDVK